MNAEQKKSLREVTVQLVDNMDPNSLKQVGERRSEGRGIN